MIPLSKLASMPKELKYSLFLIIIVVMGIGLIIPLQDSLSGIYGDPLIYKPLAGSAIRFILILGLLYFVYQKGLLSFNGLYPFTVSNLWILGASVTVILLLAFSSYEVYQQTEGPQLFLFGLNNLLVGVMEELLFRGIILPLLILFFINKPRPILKAVILSSLLFGLVHLTGLVRHPNQIVQVSYTIIFAIGIGFFFACVILRTKNILVPIFLHFLIDFTNGISDLQQEIAAKEVPTLSTILITYTVVILMAILLIGAGMWLFRRIQKDAFLQKVSVIKL